MRIRKSRYATSLLLSASELHHPKRSNKNGMKVQRGQSSEDQLTGSIESVTSKLPSATFLGLAIGAITASAILKISSKDDRALFVVQWAAPFLIMGSYSKMVKQHGSDASSYSRGA
jgi:hypothetical protein